MLDFLDNHLPPVMRGVQWMSNYVSLCQVMRFLLIFPQQLVNLGYSMEFQFESLETKMVSIVKGKKC